MTSTLSNVVFEHLSADDDNPSEPPAVVSSGGREVQPSTEGSDVAQAGEGGKGARKQWGEGEGAPLVELLQHKQLQTATYAINSDNTGTMCMEIMKGISPLHATELHPNMHSKFHVTCMHLSSVGETRIVFSKLEPIPIPTNVIDNKVEQQPPVPVGETITLKKAEDLGHHKPDNQDQASPMKEPVDEIQPSESWVIVKSEVEAQTGKSTIDEPREKVSTDRESLPDQPQPTSDTASQASDVKQAWNGSSREQDSSTVTQPAPTTPSGGGDVGRDNIEVEDIEEEEGKDNGAGDDDASNSTFTIGDEESEEKFSTPSAVTPQVCTVAYYEYVYLYT